ncbi:hypothetical protein NPIL_689081 [Nephila pilipes]|uniref:Uncharacterized protein n=1 Tax=Nephila pilipes TaxID=299642 RepID=A0A8X6K0D3_NEPPI|nr:hypothetical protein NPIL_689081 [Nephila pilipes]
MIRIQDDIAEDEWLNEVHLRTVGNLKASICFLRISGQVRCSTHYTNEFPGVNFFQPEKEVSLEKYIYLYSYIGIGFGYPERIPDRI